MRWLDRIIAVDPQRAICEAKVTQEHIFYRSDIHGIDSWLGIEMMAQAAAVFVYGQGYDKKDTVPSIAFLMSVRQFQASKPFFEAHSVLTVSVDCALLDGNMGVFMGKIAFNEQVVASAQLSAYKPSADELQQVLAG
jgi:predicted hotdog family 3-hydroxylacyl-ACP dehydratase